MLRVLTRDEFDRHMFRLEKAVSQLLSGGSFLHAIARAYYIVYATTSHAAAKHGVTVVHYRNDREVELDVFTHNAIADVVKALYTGNKSGMVSPGATPGIASGRLCATTAARYVDILQRDRKNADYGPTRVPEPYDEPLAVQRVDWARMVAQDVGGLL